MHSALGLAVIALLISASAHADSVALCAVTITSPADGATAVPLDAAVVGLTSCTTDAPLFVDDLGNAVAADLESVTGKFKLRPKVPLLPGRTYTVTFPAHQSCGSMDGRSRFSTAAKPALRKVEFAGAQGELHGVIVHLTEPVADPADLAEGSTWIAAKTDGYAPPPKVQEGPTFARSYLLSYKDNAQRPAMGARLTITLRQGLRFASGEVLAKDIEVSMVPADLEFGWSVTGLRLACEATSEPSCNAGQTGQARWGAALLAGLVLVVVGWRRGRGAVADVPLRARWARRGFGKLPKFQRRRWAWPIGRLLRCKCGWSRVLAEPAGLNILQPLTQNGDGRANPQFLLLAPATWCNCGNAFGPVLGRRNQLL